MPFSKTLVCIGVVMLLIPFLGFSIQFENSLVGLLGVAVIIIALVGRMKFRRTKPKEPAFVENAEKKQDSVSEV